MVKSENLSVLSYANRFTLWHYRSVAADITKDGYFNKVAELLRVSDMIIATTDIVYKPVTGFYSVCVNERGNVRVCKLDELNTGLAVDASDGPVAHDDAYSAVRLDARGDSGGRAYYGEACDNVLGDAP